MHSVVESPLDDGQITDDLIVEETIVSVLMAIAVISSILIDKRFTDLRWVMLTLRIIKAVAAVALRRNIKRGRHKSNALD
jgi:hypothetical protein